MRVLHGRVDGLLVMSPYVDAGLLEAILPHALPVVSLNHPERADTRIPRSVSTTATRSYRFCPALASGPCLAISAKNPACARGLTPQLHRD